MTTSITAGLARLGLHFHAPNLNERPHGGGVGPMWREGRCWLYLRPGEGWRCPVLTASWQIPTSFWHAKIEIGDGEHDLGLDLACGLFAIWLGAERILPPSWRVRERRIGLAWYEGTLTISLWENPYEWHRGQPWWWHVRITPADLVLGKHVYQAREFVAGDASIPLPEAAYPARIIISEATWTRPRWPWSRRIIRAKIEVEGGIPIPGKGENSWDIDDDAIFSLTTPAATLPAAVAAMVESVLERRLRYGGSLNWRPEHGDA
jgi:hypothetical protein